MICKPESSRKAAKIYEENRYPAHRVCPRSCKKMKISTVYLARYVNEDKTASHVTFNFGKLIEVSVEVESYRFLNMVAEIGGKEGKVLNFFKMGGGGVWNRFMTTAGASLA